MEIFIKIKMDGGLVSDVTAHKECPKVLDTSDEHWDEGYKVFEAELED
jgi:hypothetical protein